MQNRENAAKTQFTTVLGAPSQTRVLDSLSNFFITASKSIGSSALETFFLEKSNIFPPFCKSKIAATVCAAAIKWLGLILMLII